MFEQLFKGLIIGDRAIFDRNFPACYERLRYLSYGLLKESEAAKDAVNEVFEKVLKLQQDGKLSEIKDPAGWIVTVTRNHCLSKLKIESNRSRIVREKIEPHLSDSTSGDVMSPLILEDVKNCLDKSMTEKETSVWHLLTVEYMDRPEICEKLDISDNRLRAYISEIKKKVLKCIEK